MLFRDLHKKAVVMDGTFAILTDLQTRYEHDVSVQIEVLSIIACLSDIGQLNMRLKQGN